MKMQVRITIDCDNAAFEECGTWPEVVRILKTIARDVNRMDTVYDFNLRDVNGNTVCTFEVR
jgi:hypothetical protein